MCGSSRLRRRRLRPAAAAVSTFSAVLPARELKRSVRVTLTRSRFSPSAPSRHDTESLARGQVPTGARIHHARRALQHLALEITMRTSSTVGCAVQVREHAVQLQGSQSSYLHADRHARARRRPGHVAVESRHGRAHYKAVIDPLELRLINYKTRIRTRGSRFRARNCANAIVRAPSASAGRVENLSRARCGGIRRSSDGAWPQACGTRSA